jgi:hypothetical protein
MNNYKENNKKYSVFKAFFCDHGSISVEPRYEALTCIFVKTVTSFQRKEMFSNFQNFVFLEGLIFVRDFSQELGILIFFLIQFSFFLNNKWVSHAV